MISQVTFKSAAKTAGYLVAKVLGYGNTPLTADQASPFGIDSNPVQNMVAVYAETENVGDPVIIGYLIQNALTNPGETRLFSLNPVTGALSTYAWLRADGTMSLGGETNNLVRFAPLQSGINAKDELIQGELIKIAAAIAALGGAYEPGTIETNISGSEITQIKCI